MVRKVCAALLVVSVFIGGVYFGRNTNPPRHKDYSQYSADELSWIIEGIQEEMSELYDEMLTAIFELEMKTN